MFRSLLVPLDGSPLAAAAVPLARTIVEATGGSITLIRVTQSASDAEQATSHLEAVARELRQASLPVQIVVRPGEPAREILLEARRLHNDLIVMATHAPGPRSMSILTSVAHWVLSNSSAPILLAREGGDSPKALRTLLVPVDGSPGGSIALGAAVALARSSGAKLELLEVVVPVPASVYAALPGMTLGGYIDPAWEQEAVTSARAYVDRVADHLRESGLRAHSHVALGEVFAEIVNYEDRLEADLVVMSTHALRWPSQATVGSVADGVLRSGSRPILLVRREAPAGEADPGSTPTTQGWLNC
jgi:nucleotide-binding universal stress UspA family protein